LRIGVFGGTFDPPHLSHAMACFWALESGEVDRVMIVPVGRHAYGKAPIASFEHRLAMCRIAVARLGAAVVVSDIEGRRSGVSYMVDTLRILAEEHPGDRFRLLAGTDIINDIPNWREGAEVVRLAPPLEIPRPLRGELFEQRPGALPYISSTDVRSALLGSNPANKLLGAEVRAYIEKHRLYSQDHQ
jgi:nicotinate-nucleotide adenylyltransferase